MRRQILASAAAALMLACGATPEFAQYAQAGQVGASHVQKPSARIREHRRAHVRVRPRAYATTPASPAPYYWRPADPSFGPYYSLRRALSEPGRCVEDLGYGRWRYCDDD